MKRLFLALILICLIPIHVFAGMILAGSGDGDVTAPTLSTVAVNDTTWTYTYDESVTATTTAELCNDFTGTWTTAGAITQTYSSGDDTSTIVCTGSATVGNGDTLTNGLDYLSGSGSIVDGSDNALSTIDDKSVTNNTASGYLYEGIETASDAPPTDWTEVDNSGSTNDKWNCSTGNCPIDGSYSYRSPDPISGQNKIRYDFGASDEVWVAFKIHVETASDQQSNFLRFRDTTDSDIADFDVYTATGIAVGDAGGFSYSSKTTENLSSGVYYIKLRVKKGTGSNAEAEVWLTNNTTSWGTGVSDTSGTVTNQIRYFIINNYYNYDMAFIVDKMVVDDEDINISYFQ